LERGLKERGLRPLLQDLLLRGREKPCPNILRGVYPEHSVRAQNDKENRYFFLHIVCPTLIKGD
jgi:hypothetical protein